MTTHTPGPWEIDGRMVTAGRNVTVALLCEMDSFGYLFDTPNPADGWLIAAAPELLAALQAIVADVYQTDDYYSGVLRSPDVKAALAAIAKATGAANA